MATFILVHGTFAKRALWPILQQGLTEAANSVGEDAKVKEVTWSGRNSAQHRAKAASKLARAVQEIRVDQPNERIIVIAHSHGGSAAAYFLKSHAALGRCLSGCAFLSVPFVAIRLRSSRRRILLLLSYFIIVPLWVAAEAMKDLRTSIFQWIFTTVLFFVVTPLLWYLYMLRDFDPKALAETTRRAQTVDIPNGNYLFLRHSGDEAAAALSATQFFSWITMKLFRLLEIISDPLLKFPVIAAVGGLLCFSLLLKYFPEGLRYYKSTGLGPIQLLSIYLKGGDPYDIATGAAFFFVTVVLPIAFIIFGITAGMILLAQVLTARSFGWKNIAAGLMVEFAVEPVPFGSYPLIHIDWSDHTQDIGDMTHSWSYQQSDAIRAIQHWTIETLQKHPSECS
ncbi:MULTISPECIES: esterase/lipase family protein [unclassified Bradyrhizobium]|uniref:esterase/lipase family protein n=1 Tax=Bradyrhizobium sp. USDA 4541 TaxID=2817704 RepID=UPI0020A5106C|nr:hypothetical protein [Bradyrhizobium sp. USDA 4541]MCP1846754.1 pimeloyl-ACP methyl ester carboxylesterase [Bradyrhizobium sp. USDA 4541]